MVVNQLVRRPALLRSQPIEPLGREVVAQGLGKEVGGVGDGGDEAAAFQSVHSLVDRALGSSGDGDKVDTVEEGHLGQGAQGFGFASLGSHFWASSLSFSMAFARSLKSRTFLLSPAPASSRSWAESV